LAAASPAIFTNAPYLERDSSLSPQQLVAIDHFAEQVLTGKLAIVKKTHYFHGRYENIYVDRQANDDLNALISEAHATAADILQLDKEQVRMGFWLNLMPPGHVTTLHRHDDFDELLSGVVYVAAQPNSGNLILHVGEDNIVLNPRVGGYYFFDPATPHAVSENRSDRIRLSIGMNFGPAESE
jgi:hypothetical protein